MKDKEHVVFDPQLFIEAFHRSPFGICIIDNRGNYLELNQSFVELLGYEKPEELLGKQFKDITHPEDVDLDRELTEKIFSGAISGFELDKRFIKKNQEVVWAKLYARTYEDFGIGILQPIDARAQFENKLAKLKKDLDQFVYKTSHDLRSPVTNILGLADLKHSNANDYEEYMRMIKENALRLDRIIREISAYSTNQQFPVKYEEVNLDKTIDQVCTSVLQEMSKSKQINLSKSIHHHNGVSIDRARLIIILKNLIDNAVNFTGPKGNIEVIAELRGTDLVVRVKDDGMGIRKDIQAKIYDMFYRGSNISEGAGLGLFIVKEVLEEIKGNISFQSEEGRGSEFTVEIPVPQS